MTFFIIVVTATALQRLIELRIAERNTRALRMRGAREFGARHYWLLVSLHTAFIFCLVGEYLYRRPALPSAWFIPLLLFAGAQWSRVWIIRSMQGRWTTRILVLPGTPPIATGPFRYLPHPNYCVVALELAALPLIFGLTYTALAFTLMNAAILGWVRIPEERRALNWAMPKTDPSDSRPNGGLQKARGSSLAHVRGELEEVKEDEHDDPDYRHRSTL